MYQDMWVGHVSSLTSRWRISWMMSVNLDEADDNEFMGDLSLRE